MLVVFFQEVLELSDLTRLNILEHFSIHAYYNLRPEIQRMSDDRYKMF